MNKPPLKTMLLGHPLVATPLTLGGGAGLFASLFMASGNGRLLPALICIAVAATAVRANEQAVRYSRWKAEWDSMGDGPAPRTVRPGRVVAVLAIAALMLLVYARPLLVAYWAGYALGWVSHQPWLLAGLGVVGAAILVQFVRHWPRRTKPSTPVSVVAKRILPVPTIADAYRGLPPYCHALLRGRP